MPKGPAARLGDLTSHPLPGVLTGSGSPNVLIRGQPAWRGIGAGNVQAIQTARKAADQAIKAAEAATKAAAGTPGLPAAKAAEELVKATTAASMATAMSGFAAAGVNPKTGGMPDIHACTTPLPLPPHGPGLVIDGSKTVLINGMPACRMGDTIVEAVGPPNKITKGEASVVIGG